MFKKASKNVSALTPDPFFPSPSTSSARKIPGPSASLVETEEIPDNKDGDSDASDQQQKEISKWNTLLISCAAQI
jgi:hypothetical protein